MVSWIGDATFLVLFGMTLFAAFLMPQVMFEQWARRDAWLYCPGCGHFLGRIRAMRCLSHDGLCVRCSREVEIAPIAKRAFADTHR